MEKQEKISKILLKKNLIFTFIAIFLNGIFFLLFKDSINFFFELDILLNCFLLYFYYNNLFSTLRIKLNAIKKEANRTNFALLILLLFLILVGIFCFSVYLLYRINPQAISTFFVINIFVNTLTKFLPLIILWIFVFLVTPAFIIPNYDNNKYKKVDKILLIFLLLFILLSFLEVAKITNSLQVNMDEKKYILKKITFEYNNKYLKFKDISEIAKNKILKNGLVVPFLYTEHEEIKYTYDEAEAFCKSLNAEVCSLSEVYNILIDKFELKGEKYFWTRDKAGRNPLLLHFKNLTYEAIKSPETIQARVICTTKNNQEYLKMQKKIVKEEQVSVDTNLNLENNTENISIEEKNIENNPIQKNSNFVGFNIKTVTEEYFDRMLQKGYIYKKDTKLNNAYKILNIQSEGKVRLNGNKVTLCLFPFITYDDFSIDEEKEVWKQNFCIPSFEIVDAPIVEKTMYQKDSYCLSYGGRVPNIPELQGILKSTNRFNMARNYWVSNKVNGKGIVYYNLSKVVSNARFANNEEKADVICIKDTKDSVNIISNFSSKFSNESGLYYAKQKCPDCDYYEMPDMVLNQ